MSSQLYQGPGYGYVFRNGTTIQKVAELFLTKRVWPSKELNEEVGWQFSQAVYHLRRRGWPIITTRDSDSGEFSYELRTNSYEV